MLTYFILVQCEQSHDKRAFLLSDHLWTSIDVKCTIFPCCIHIHHHLAVCLTTGPKTFPKRALHIVQSRASSFKWEYPLLSLKSSNSFLCLLPCLPVTSISPCIFPSVTRCKRQFQCKMWPIEFAFCLHISCRIFLCSLTLSNASSFLTWSNICWKKYIKCNIWRVACTPVLYIGRTVLKG